MSQASGTASNASTAFYPLSGRFITRTRAGHRLQVKDIGSHCFSLLAGKLSASDRLSAAETLGRGGARNEETAKNWLFLAVSVAPQRSGLRSVRRHVTVFETICQFSIQCLEPTDARY